MQSPPSRELRVSSLDRPKKIMFNAKEKLLTNESIEVSAISGASSIACSACQILNRLGYVTFENIKTETFIENGKRITKLVITIKKTDNFDKLYKEHQEERKKKEEEAKKDA